MSNCLFLVRKHEIRDNQAFFSLDVLFPASQRIFYTDENTFNVPVHKKDGITPYEFTTYDKFIPLFLVQIYDAKRIKSYIVDQVDFFDWASQVGNMTAYSDEGKSKAYNA